MNSHCRTASAPLRPAAESIAAPARRRPFRPASMQRFDDHDSLNRRALRIGRIHRLHVSDLGRRLELSADPKRLVAARWPRGTPRSSRLPARRWLSRRRGRRRSAAAVLVLPSASGRPCWTTPAWRWRRRLPPAQGDHLVAEFVSLSAADDVSLLGVVGQVGLHAQEDVLVGQRRRRSRDSARAPDPPRRCPWRSCPASARGVSVRSLFAFSQYSTADAVMTLRRERIARRLLIPRRLRLRCGSP